MSSDEADLTSMVEDMSATISDLETSLQPLLSQPISTTSSKLPLLDKAKLYVLTTYALESILFSALRLNGIDAKEHAVFKELARVKEYFSKIKAAEGSGATRGMVVDREAAGRMINHAIGGEGRKRKAVGAAVGTHTRFEGAAKRLKGGDDGRVSSAEGSVRERPSKYKKFDDGDQSEDDFAVEQNSSREGDRAPKSGHEITDGYISSSAGDVSKSTTKKKKKGKKKSKGQKLEDERPEEMK